MEWNNLLSEERLGGRYLIEEFTEKAYPRSEYEKDFRRIISSASFRRMQDKTQVFPLDKSDFIRTRLTHSYETAALAKTLGTMILKKTLQNKCSENICTNIQYVPDLLYSAGLLHDIGNPPFGHFGEEIIKKWFVKNLGEFTVSILDDEVKDKKEENETLTIPSILGNYAKDLTNFDGNAQVLRVLIKLHNHDGNHGMNLTDALINTLIKYPTSSKKIIKDEKDPKYNIAKKMGYFQAEQICYENITQRTGAVNCRHPLTLILEVADDIAYLTSDIEDGLKKGLFTLDMLLSYIEERKAYYINTEKEYSEKVDILFDKLAKIEEENTCKSASNVDVLSIQIWIPYAQEWLMYCAAHSFNSNYSKIINGKYYNDLFFKTYHHVSVMILRDVLKDFIFPNREIIKLELAANTILSSLLSIFVPAVLYHDGKYKSEKFPEIQAYKRIYSIISDNYCTTYNHQLIEFESTINNMVSEGSIQSDDATKRKLSADIYSRLMLAVDYISGMTDSFAKSLYQELNGIY